MRHETGTNGSTNAGVWCPAGTRGSHRGLSGSPPRFANRRRDSLSQHHGSRCFRLALFQSMIAGSCLSASRSHTLRRRVLEVTKRALHQAPADTFCA